MVKTLNYSSKKGSLSSSQRRGVITLLEKKGKDPAKIKNWRPVALLNTDFKIFTKTLARRLEKFIPFVIHSDQSGFVKGRYNGESIRFVEDLILKLDHENIEGIVLQLDFEKAFDSIEWKFMFDVLKKVNLGDQFISYVRCCYTDIYSCINNNGFATNWFQLGRGVRQGCPLSCLLFILCVEIMSKQIRNNKNIKGIFINGVEHKIKQFADDCTCTVKDVPSVYSLIESIKGFSLCSGLKLNAEKSLILCLGPWKNRSIKIGDKIEPSTLQLLGVEIGRDNRVKDKLNFEDRLVKIRNCLQQYSHRKMSICGRNLIAKTMGISKIIHTMSIMDTNISFLSRLQMEINRFIWSYKPAKVKHTVMIGGIKQNGLNSVDIKIKNKTLRLPWIYRIINGSGWNDIIQEYLAPMGGLLLLLRCNYDTKFLNFIPKFHRNILEYAKEMLRVDDVHLGIWNNKNVLIDGKSIFLENVV